MSKVRVVSVAYVTKWAATAGIRIVRGAEVTASGALTGLGLYVIAKDWTEDKAEAEERYLEKLHAARQSALRKVEKLEALYRSAPKYTEG